jgi:hypothetical protein
MHDQESKSSTRTEHKGAENTAQHLSNVPPKNVITDYKPIEVTVLTGQETGTKDHSRITEVNIMTPPTSPSL